MIFFNFPAQGLVVRYQPDGSLDERFAVDGFMSFSAGEHNAQVSHIVQQDNDDLCCFGSSRDPMHCLFHSGPAPAWWAARWQLWQWHRVGPHPAGAQDTATSLAVQTDGAIVVGGYSLDGNYRAVVARYQNEQDGRFLPLIFRSCYGKLRAS